MRPSVAAVPVAVVVLLVPVFAAAGAATAASGATYKCRAQTISWSQGKKNVLDTTKGPKTRTKGTGGVTLADGRVKAGWGVAPGLSVPSKFLDIVTTDMPGQQVTRLESVTLYPTKGKAKTFKIVRNPDKDEVYTYDLIKSYGQVQVPTSGDDGSGRATPKLKKVVVKAQESCFATQ
jgi:hypothetical protein